MAEGEDGLQETVGDFMAVVAVDLLKGGCVSIDINRFEVPD